ncbi:MAG: hypothetical protein A3H91_13435 [Gammaproteobacteria bacterium RIFCSPLOWO2_02_FULL_61_13]|nr:MAG: hypothetical protein A3H91_13435 [Gammaproteobacteria bacterium RIFCSPLOWO2_02_FULL_61_13]
MIVDTLLVIAGPRACGKSTFIANCRSNKALTRIAPDLARLFELAPKSVRMTQVERHAGRKYPAAILHLDIYSPFEYAPVLPRDQLQAWMTVERFGAHTSMKSVRDARELYAVTLFAPRQKTLERWLQRKAAGNRRQVSTNLAQILADSGSGEALYRHLYSVWLKFLAASQPVQHWHATEKDGGYAIEVAGSD